MHAWDMYRVSLQWPYAYRCMHEQIDVSMSRSLIGGGISTLEDAQVLRCQRTPNVKLPERHYGRGTQSGLGRNGLKPEPYFQMAFLKPAEFSADSRKSRTACTHNWMLCNTAYRMLGGCDPNRGFVLVPVSSEVGMNIYGLKKMFQMVYQMKLRLHMVFPAPNQLTVHTDEHYHLNQTHCPIISRCRHQATVCT